MSQINEIEIGGVVYDLAGSGSGGGIDTFELLYTNPAQTNPTSFDVGNIDEYSALYFEYGTYESTGTYRSGSLVPKEEINNIDSTHLLVLVGHSSRQIILNSYADGVFTIREANAYILMSVYGVKGGSGSGGGTGYSKTVLWTGNSAPSEITFESSLKDYDLILFEGMLSNGVGNYTLSNIYSKEDIVDNRELGVYSNESYLWYHYTADSDTITLSAGSANNVLTNIIGIKFSGGSGEGGSSTLSGLTDVELDEAPSAGQVLTYDADSSKWINADSTGGTEVEGNPTNIDYQPLITRQDNDNNFLYSDYYTNSSKPEENWHPYNLSDGDTTTAWAGSKSNAYIGYAFDTEKQCTKVSITSREIDSYDLSQSPTKFDIQAGTGTRDNITWSTLKSCTCNFESKGQTLEFTFNNNNKYKYYRLLLQANKSDDHYYSLGEMQFYSQDISSLTDLNSIKIGEEVYKVNSSSTEVEANPTETGTESLSSIKIDNEVYSIPTGSKAEVNGTNLIIKNNSATGSESNKHIYSTEEQVVGTWIDGKPIYEISYIGTKTYTGNSSTEVDTGFTKPSNIKDIIFSSASILNNILASGDTNIYLGGTYIKALIGLSDDSNKIGFSQALTSKQITLTYRITIQYTKTTDITSGGGTE